MNPHTFPRLGHLAVAASLVVSGCAVMEDTKVDYKTAKPATSLEIPPDLTQVGTRNTYAVPGQVVSAAQVASSQAVAKETAPQRVGDVRVERLGQQRWLVTARDPEYLWPRLKAFWQDNGFTLVVDQRELGILETEWAENRAKLPQDFIRESLGKIFDALYSTGTRDKYRTRLERNAKGETEIYVTHRGMEEVYTNESKNNTVWQPRPNEPELEAEFMRRMMVALGTKAEAADAAIQSTAAPNARLVTQDGQSAIAIPEGFDRAWRRVGLSLDRTGFTVIDRDRSNGVYDVRFAITEKNKDSGFFGKLFSSSKDVTTPKSYKLLVKELNGQTFVYIQNEKSQPDGSDNAKKILTLLTDDLK